MTTASPSTPPQEVTGIPWTQRLGHEIGFIVNRLLRRPHRLKVELFGQPVILAIESRREISRAAGFALEASLMQRLLDHVKPGDVIYDVGANIGLISLLVALHPAGRECRVHSFEPEPRNFAELSRNIKLNALQDRVTPHQVALGKEEGEAALFVRGSTGDGRHSIAAAEGATGSVKVVLTTATAFCRSSGHAPDVVKIDVEGAEGDVLAGMAGVIAERKPREILMEIHRKGGKDQMPDGGTIDAWLQERGYTLVWDQQRRSGVHRHYQRA